MKTLSSALLLLLAVVCARGQSISLEVIDSSASLPALVMTDTSQIKLYFRIHNPRNKSVQLKLCFDFFRSNPHEADTICIMSLLPDSVQEFIQLAPHESITLKYTAIRCDSNARWLDSSVLNYLLSYGILPFDSSYHTRYYLYEYVGDVYTLAASSLYRRNIQEISAPLNHVPAPQDTFTWLAQEIFFNWKSDLYLNEQVLYNIKIYELLDHQSIADAVSQNSPLVNDTVRRETEYTWIRTADSLWLNDDSSANKTQRFAWTVQALIDTLHPSPVGAGAGLSAASMFTLCPLRYPYNHTLGFDSAGVLAFAHKYAFPMEDEASYLQAAYLEYIDDTAHFSDVSISAGINQFPCANGGFEDSSFTGWGGWTGRQTGLEHFNLQMDQVGINSNPNYPKWSQHYIMTSTPTNIVLDEKTFLPVVPPGGGKHSVRIGDYGFSGSRAAGLYYKFTVDQDNQHFKFRYMAVLNDPSFETIYQKKGYRYLPSEKPFFWVTLLDKNTGQQREIIKLLADMYNPYCKINAQEKVVYTEWLCAGLNLEQHLGHEVIVSFIAADCSRNGHFGYAYIDGLCEEQPVTASLLVDTAFCMGDSLMADASGSSFAHDTYWKLQYCDAQGNLDSTKIAERYFPAKVPGRFNLRNFGSFLRCGQYYMLTLGVRSTCGEYRFKKQKIYIYPCPQADAGDDVYMCVNNLHSVTLGASSAYPSGTSFEWFDANGVSLNLFSQQISVSPAQSSTYILKTGHMQLCGISSDTVQVFVEQPISGLDIIDNKSFCPTVLSAKVWPQQAGKYYYLWSQAAETSKWIVLQNPNNVAFVVIALSVANSCGMVTHNRVLPTMPVIATMPALVYTNAASPLAADTLRQKHFVADKHYPAGFGPAYSNIGYELRVNSRDGAFYPAKSRFSTDLKGLINTEITWDCKIKGSLVPAGQYLWKLRFYGCNTEVQYRETYLKPSAIPVLGLVVKTTGYRNTFPIQVVY